MGLLNSRHGYGALTKALHWAIVALFAAQYLGAWIMLRTPADAATLGIMQADLLQLAQVAGTGRAGRSRSAVSSTAGRASCRHGRRR